MTCVGPPICLVLSAAQSRVPAQACCKARACAGSTLPLHNFPCRGPSIQIIAPSRPPSHQSLPPNTDPPPSTSLSHSLHVPRTTSHPRIIIVMMAHLELLVSLGRSERHDGQCLQISISLIWLYVVRAVCIGLLGRYDGVCWADGHWAVDLVLGIRVVGRRA